MSQELIYTSAPKGLRPGSHGFCTVASTANMPPNLAEKLEALSGYRHVFAPGDTSGPNPVVFSYLRLAVGGRNYYVLSRVADAGHDYTQRTNKIAHHIALDQHELTPTGPAWLMAQPGFMETAWESEPRILPAGRKPPQGNSEARVCHAWESLVGDAGWAGVLAETATPGNARYAVLIYEPGTDLLPLIAESLALLPAKRRWGVSFSTYFTKLPPGLDCQWRCVIAGSPEAKMARAVPKALVLDLTTELGPAEGGELVTAARTGTIAEPVAASVAKAPSTGRQNSRAAMPPRLAESEASDDFSIGPPPTVRRAPGNFAVGPVRLPKPRNFNLRAIAISLLMLLVGFAAGFGAAYRMYQRPQQEPLIASAEVGNLAGAKGHTKSGSDGQQVADNRSPPRIGEQPSGSKVVSKDDAQSSSNDTGSPELGQVAVENDKDDEQSRAQNSPPSGSGQELAKGTEEPTNDNVDEPVTKPPDAAGSTAEDGTETPGAPLRGLPPIVVDLGAPQFVTPITKPVDPQLGSPVALTAECYGDIVMKSKGPAGSRAELISVLNEPELQKWNLRDESSDKLLMELTIIDQLLSINLTEAGKVSLTRLQDSIVRFNSPKQGVYQSLHLRIPLAVDPIKVARGTAEGVMPPHEVSTKRRLAIRPIPLSAPYEWTLESQGTWVLTTEHPGLLLRLELKQNGSQVSIGYRWACELTGEGWSDSFQRQADIGNKKPSVEKNLAEWSNTVATRSTNLEELKNQVVSPNSDGGATITSQENSRLTMLTQYLTDAENHKKQWQSHFDAIADADLAWGRALLKTAEIQYLLVYELESEEVVYASTLPRP